MSGRTYIIAEIGINHNGSLGNCFKLIDAAADAGCDAAKFQLFQADALYPRSAGKLDWKSGDQAFSYDIFEASGRFETPADWLPKLSAHCVARRIDFLSSAFDPAGVDLLVGLGVKKLKLSSYTLTNVPLIEDCAKRGLPIILSTGGGTLGETEQAVALIEKYEANLTLLHCSINYPTKLAECNLGVLDTLKLAFPGVNVGWSDHTREISAAPEQAVFLGAEMVEKHITLGKRMDGPDHFFALEPEELKEMVRAIRSAEKERDSGSFEVDPVIYGQTARTTYPQERYLREFAYMCLFARRAIKRGERITAADISILRPGKKERGLEPKHLSLFSNHTITAKKDIAFEGAITWDLVLS